MRKWLNPAIMILLAAAVFSTVPARAQSDNCLKVVGTDWASEQQSVDH